MAQMKIKTLFTPTALVCLLALSSHALPILPPSSPSPSTEHDIHDPAFGSPFRRVSRPITIQIDIEPASSSSSSSSSSTLALLIEQTEKREQYLRQFEQLDQEEFARLQQEQDELEKVEQDLDQLLDNQEEEQLDQDPETIRRRQEESLGLWMTDSEFEALGEDVPSLQDQSTEEEEEEEEEEDRILLNKGGRFDLYAEDFKEVTGSLETSFSQIRARSLTNVDSTLPSEEEMLQWPVINLSQFEDRQDEVQDEYEDEA
ncbi:MAG: hypothetical protein J3Q66DRAFT_194752 [Benniella sp.]|nr:MAG: hypothetical protein J3Q66DRAFT_194752 [Benniella sp.]